MSSYLAIDTDFRRCLLAMSMIAPGSPRRPATGSTSTATVPALSQQHGPPISARESSHAFRKFRSSSDCGSGCLWARYRCWPGILTWGICRRESSAESLDSHWRRSTVSSFTPGRRFRFTANGLHYRNTGSTLCRCRHPSGRLLLRKIARTLSSFRWDPPVGIIVCCLRWLQNLVFAP